MDSVLGLAGKNAVVWGGGAGIGRATVEMLAASGSAVGVVDIDAALAEATARDMRALGHRAVGVAADVTDQAQVAAAAAKVRAELGPIQLSASVVGIAYWKPLLEMTLEEWNLDQRRNILPAFLIGKEIAGGLKAAGLPGSIVFVGSVSGLQAADQHASYGAAKSAMTSLVKSMAGEWGGLGIRVNCVAPGPIHTQRVQPSEQMLAILKRKVPLGRFGKIHEVAGALTFLLSELSSYVTGHTLLCDGGWMAAPPVHPSDNPRLELGAKT